MNNTVERWRPILLAAIETQPAEEATDTIIALIPLIMRESVAQAPPSPPRTRQRRSRQAPSSNSAAKQSAAATTTKTSQILNTTGSARSAPATPSTPPASTASSAASQAKTPVDPARPMLNDEEFFTVDQACEYLGIAPSNMYNMISADAGRFPHRVEKIGDRGHTRKLLLGRGINKYRLEREKRERQRQQRQHGAANPDRSPITDDSDPDITSDDSDGQDLGTRDGEGDGEDRDRKSSNGMRVGDY